ncbi:MAG: hypothetical protein GY765_34745 [bacterium]|nr:hypothetical protein [bacterium]
MSGNLVTHPPGGSDLVVPRNFTIVLFGREPHRFFRGAYAVFSVYHGKDKTSKRSQRFELFGPIPALLRDLLARLQIYMGMDIDKSEAPLNGKTNQWRFSQQAVKEAIVNAFVHRDYHSHEPVRVTVFEDSIEVTSPGGSYAPMGLEAIRKGEIFTAWRNPSLAWFMVELEYAQNEGQGIRTIMELTKETAGKEPEFTILKDWFRVAIPAYNPLLVNLQKKREPGFPMNSTQESNGTEVGIGIDLKAALPAFEIVFHQLKDVINAAPDAEENIKNELVVIEDKLDGISFESCKTELINPFKKLGRLLVKLGDDESDFNRVLRGTETGTDLAWKLSREYNNFAQWLALSKLPAIN